MARAPSTSACRPEPQRRLTVAPGTVTGSPASSALMRATLRLSSPAWFAQPSTHVVDRRRIGPGAPHDLGDHQRRQVVRANLGQRAPVPPERRPDRLDHERLAQGRGHPRDSY